MDCPTSDSPGRGAGTRATGPAARCQFRAVPGQPVSPRPGFRDNSQHEASMEVWQGKLGDDGSAFDWRLDWGRSHPRNRLTRVTQQGCQTTVHSPNARPPGPRFRMLRPNSRPRDGPPRSTERGSHDSSVTWNRPGWRPQPHASPKLRPVRPRFRIRRWHLSSSGVGCRGGPPFGADGRPLERMWSSPGPKRGWIRHWVSGAAAARRRDQLRR